MDQSLRNLATVTRGYSFRSSIDTDSDGPVRVVQASDLAADGTLDPTRTPTRIAERRFALGQYLQPGDILVSARAIAGTPYRVSVYGHSGTVAVAASSMYIVRVASPLVDSAYLAVALQSETVQQYLHQHSAGSQIQSLTATVLGDLVLHLPTLEYQRAVMSLIATNREYQILQGRKLALQSAVIRACVVV